MLMRRKPAPIMAGRLGVLVLATATGLVMLPAAMTAAPAARPAAVTAHTAISFQPCPCDKPICRPGCSQL
jgi:hypothetical protein